jgi:hypothetical protein
MPEPEPTAQLVLTTLPHFVAAWIAALYGHPYYAMIVASSTILSVLWHASGSESKGMLYMADYTAAVIWAAADFWMWPESIGLNGAVFVLHWTMPSHSQWHLVSAGKAILIAACL